MGNDNQTKAGDEPTPEPALSDGVCHDGGFSDIVTYTRRSRTSLSYLPLA
jgi:hypothetical protein